MATREKKPRSVNSDSPTPSLGGGSDSTPSTPTSKGKGSRTSLSRQKSKQLQNTNEDSVQSTDDISDAAAATTETIGGSGGSKTNRTTRGATKDDPSEPSAHCKEKDDSSKDAKDSRKTVTKKKKTVNSSGSGARTKTTVSALKKTTLMKRKTRPIIGKPVLGKKVIARKQMNAKGKKVVTVTVKEDDSKNTSLRNGKPRATDSPLPKRKLPTPKDKSPRELTSDVVTVKMERRRSDSVSKCSDVTEASTVDTSFCKEDDDKKDDTTLLEIKRELMQENELKTKLLDKMAETFNEQRKTPTVLNSKDEKTVRRSARQRKSTTRDRDEFVTPKLKAPVEIKSEPVDTDEAESVPPLTIDTESPAKEAPSSELEKDSSLSPDLVSEGVSEISVKEFYSEPAFLENNLGIEKDPKLGEIVQGQEKIKLDKCSGSSPVANGGGSSVKSGEIGPVVVKEEKIEDEEMKEHNLVQEVKLESEHIEVEKLREIIGIVEPTKTIPPIVVIPKEENSGNESPVSDRSNDKDMLSSIYNKVESMLKKNDSRSDSDGERTSKQTVSRGKTTVKEAKPKARNVKEKSKEDEKAKEEKLRQEKLRVEEKVREEKLRAELLKLEEQKKLMEEKSLQDVKNKRKDDIKEIMLTAAPELIGKQDNFKQAEEVVSVVEKVLPTTTLTTLSLTSADSHLVLSVTSSDAIDVVESPKMETAKLDPIVTNTITLENLPAITLLKKDPKQMKDDTKVENVVMKAELKILPINDDKQKEKDRELPVHSMGENNATIITLTSVTAQGNQSPLSVIKISSEEDCANTAIFKEMSAETQEIEIPEAVENRDEIMEDLQLDIRKNVDTESLDVTDVLPVVDPSTKSTTDDAASLMVLEESEDVAKQKEFHLKNLGLLTLQAASAEKQRRKELILQNCTGGGGSGSGYSSSSSSGKGSKSSRNSESTGTLKTVIKLNRGEKRKPRLPLKMTLQKGKGKGTEKDANGSGGNGETAFYIIQNETEHQNQSMTDATGVPPGRKAHSRSHTTDGVTLTEVVAETAVKDVVQKALVIPEKASSFNVHPERLCQDQCFYCGGKFGLYDTPCHIAGMKSTERQQKILAGEVKIKIDSCLCDACFRHVDRKANCASYRRRTEAKSLSSLAKIRSSLDASQEEKQSQDDSVSIPGAVTVDNVSLSITQDSQEPAATARTMAATNKLEADATDETKIHGNCHVRSCGAGASHTIRRKWLLKMRKTISKIFEINLEQTSSLVSNLIPICDGHYELISHLMVCAMCKRRLPKNHIYYIVNEIPQLERLIQEQGIAMKLGNSTLVVCKLCRYYANLLLKPPDAKSQKAQFIKNYNRRLLQFSERENEQQENIPAVVEPSRVVTNPDIVISDGEEEESIEVVTMGESVSLHRRSRHVVHKATDLAIVDGGGGGGCAQMSDLEEVTITPTPKLIAPVNVNISGNSSIVLDTDVSVEQPASAEKQRKDDGLDMAKALKANPNISMRELFPGEEELSVHINIPFSAATTRTPEGWAKVTTTLQYDDSTRALWEELQKPYGNQSSFLRHLILLEKYYRNGDLILSPQAKNNAATYSEAIQNRLRSFDNIPTPPPPPAAPAAAIDKSTIFQQLGNAPITITPTGKLRTKSSTEPISLLKSNNPHLVGGTSTPTDPVVSTKRKLSVDTNSKSTGAKQDPVPGNKIIKLDETIVVPGSKTCALVPPELISINTKQNVTITTIPVATSKSQTSGTQQNQSAAIHQQSLIQPQQQSLLQSAPQNKKSPGSTGAGAREIIKLPDQLTEAERRETSKPWRPTLIPITPGSAEAIKAGPLYQTADGRRLPKLVQVMSGGKPYHISINDYNRMCILRREKLLQQQQQLLQQQINQHQKRLQQQSPPNQSTLSAVTKPPNVKITDNQMSSKMVQIPNQILEQNSLIPIASSINTSNNNNSGSILGSSKTMGLSTDQLQQLIKTRKPGGNSHLSPPVTSSTTTSAFMRNTMAMNAPTKAISLPNSTSVFSMTVPSHQSQQQQHPSSATSPVATLPTTTTTSSQIDQLLKGSNQFLNSFVSQSQLNAMVVAAAAAAAAAAASNSNTTPGGTSSGGGSILMDNSAAQLLSKIPKSLTVIPQQKQRSLSRVSSNEDQSSA
ncbi:uncharacterized protein LOC129775075 [Toxorhynchites rutilus septentrionalis]|uniref:uncharacterized protein LOC129775075 n=1 Tax=Toxorhynchites rutilus septentrionalis TaxID=329112 RepID=UPI00247AB6A6|nr:uncharacterized protein LOC129775075 [Toxorhynchites rutilus septentrionalis]XP_055635293.1 uncharacterized protein LOC129775075 [Toxorhynchites rutilus septentrionalis]XP_055635294.1 uncharacterized protein LOC129775075 [Toxorhynchites rutilus septentrionalis]